MPKDRLFPPDERLEEGRIRERMKAMPVWRKDFVEKKQRGPVVGCIVIIASYINVVIKCKLNAYETIHTCVLNCKFVKWIPYR